MQLLIFNEEFLVNASHIDYVPALCTHRPSLLPIEWLSEFQGLLSMAGQPVAGSENWIKLDHLEEVKVVTRFPLTYLADKRSR